VTNLSAALLPDIPRRLAHFSARALEWERLRALVAGHAQSAAGRAWIAALEPSADLAWILREQEVVDEARLLIRAGAAFSFSDLHDMREALAQARIDGVALDGVELLEAAALASRLVGWSDLLRVPPTDLQGKLPRLTERASALLDSAVRVRLTQLHAAVTAKIDPDGSVAENASPELRRIRREQDRQRRVIEQSLRATLRKLAGEGSVQDEVITMRGERFVIPVKVEQKRRVSGVVHGASSSGQTVFVEPLETIEQNNELVRLLEEEQEEIRRILLALTRQVGAVSAELLEGTAILTEADAALGRARFAERYNCCTSEMWDGEGTQVSKSRPGAPDFEQPGMGAPPLDSERWEQPPTLLLREARHPLLEERLRRSGGAITPLSVTFSGDARQLVISGPNAGGKSVSLKAVGLFALMAQAGIPVPAEAARLPVFSAVLADIGDAQSIEQDLSTFSAHVTNVEQIAEAVASLDQESRALVLLDELGSATDPEEGSALAVAIAEHFLGAQVWSVISTHFTALKVYATNHAGVLNAAVGFDEETLAPTYRLRVGVPGASAGINMAERLGMRSAIVLRARERMGAQGREISSFLESLHAQLDAAQGEREQLRRGQQEIVREKQRMEFEGRKEQKEKVRELERKLEELLKDMEYRARENVRAVEDRAAQQKLSKDAERRIAKARREFREQFNQSVVAHSTGADAGDANATPHLVKNIAPGDTVKLRSLGGKVARVERQIEENIFEVMAGNMKMRVARSDIAQVIRETVAQSPLESARSRGVRVSVNDEEATSVGEINVIGQTAEEAERNVERFVDRAFLAGMAKVRIVHGSGMGVLRRTLRAYLKTHPQVLSATEPPHNEGGQGVTMVELKV
jgi:DNA mismatch repair protein MutS2